MQWSYDEFVNIAPNNKGPQNNEFIITVVKGKKTDTMRFSTDHRADLLSEALVNMLLNTHSTTAIAGMSSMPVLWEGCL